jgi:hypothetical protein
MVLQQLISTFKVNETAASHGSAGSLQAGRQQATSRKSAGKKRLNSSKKQGTLWGSPPSAESPDPVIELDDRDFGKY